ncbi:MAG: 16S rRNA (guanine(966)-N(2))-methyltransferase RsmD [Gammaproteobacteria bacterium]
MGNIRIIGGQWRSRKILVPPKVRPTSDRVRETLFNWLRPHLFQAVCLDAFAGTGILGLEALSHGASKVYFNDESSSILKQLNSNIHCLKPSPATYALMQHTLPQHLSITTPVNIVFLDPPFHEKKWHKLLSWLIQQPWLKDDALIYVEHEKDYELPLINWEFYRQKTAGEVCYGLLRKTSSDTP